LSHFRAWLRTSNVAASGFGFGRDCNGFTDYRHFNQNPCNSILSLYLSAFHFFVVTLHYQTNQITVFPKLFQIKNKEHQSDWLQSMEILQLTENSDNDVSGNIIFFHVPAGQEKEWVNKFKTYDFVEWAELNHYVDINPWP